ncbi:MAG: carboxypeptidase regulatory-like domain-containing protein [Anaerolineae bacterium]|nr:carboxypeptidase regulatory-like domain-containing protein [Anaerolineae bacterium]
MKNLSRSWVVVALLLGTSIALSLANSSSSLAQQPSPALVITGQVDDTQNTPVAKANVQLLTAGQEVLSEVMTQADGRYVLPVPAPVPNTLAIHIDRPHFEETVIELDAAEVRTLQLGESLVMPDTVLPRTITVAFWIAAAIFVGMLLIVASGKVHTTLAALAGASLVFAVSYLGHPISKVLFIFDFQRAIQYIDWNVIFLIMGMMIVIAVVERTGIFQWLAFAAYRASGGRLWLLLPILMLITGIASALLDNVTTMLLMTPISIQIALALGINPLALLMPEVMASNVVGISTLIGTPTNILIGSYANISFNDFLKNLTPGVLLALIGLVIYSEIVYRKSLHAPAADSTSAMLLDRLAERARITEPEHLRKASWIGAGMLLLFIFGEHIHLLPAVTALMGATALMLWIRPDIEEMIEAVDWTTLVFFMCLFIVVGAIQEVGLVSLIATTIGDLVGDNLLVAILAVTWFSAILSTVIANIPFTAAMLPVVGYLSATVPGAEGKVLFYCLSVGSAMGGNGSLIGASANMVTAGIAERAGHPITYVYFLKKGFPALLLTVTLALIWLLIRFLVL